jgi:hypothetical protein
MKAYLVDGDVVFGGPQDKSFRCVYYGTAKGKIVAGFVAFREGNDAYSCKVDLLRRGPYLVAQDNSYCGGMNVRFSGILMKVRGGK